MAQDYASTKIYVVAPEKLVIPNEEGIIRLSPDLCTGDTIADKGDYSELRAHYWVWKNDLSSSPVGLFQFRRYLDVSGKKDRPYRIARAPAVDLPAVEELMSRCRVVAPLPEYTGLTVRERFCRMHRAEDLIWIEGLIAEKYPAYCCAMNDYLSGREEYYCNLYIMHRAEYNAYCQWLFSILSEYDRQAKNVPPRMQGYLAERLFGIWFLHYRQEHPDDWAEVPRVHFWCYDDRTHHLKKERFRNLLLPPGSRRRYAVREFIYKVKK